MVMSFLGRLRPPKRLRSSQAHHYTGNWQLPFLNQCSGENDRFYDQFPRKYVVMHTKDAAEMATWQCILSSNCYLTVWICSVRQCSGTSEMAMNDGSASDSKTRGPGPIPIRPLCDFTSFSTVLQSYQDDRRLIMKACVQWSSVYSWEDFASLGDRPRSARSVDQRLAHWGTRAPSRHDHSCLP